MHSTLASAATGLAFLSFIAGSSAGVAKRQTGQVCVNDPVYKGMWYYTPNYDDVNTFCASMVGVTARSRTVGTNTVTSTTRQSITETTTVVVDTYVPGHTVTETTTNLDFRVARRAAVAAVTDAPYLEEARAAVRRQAASITSAPSSIDYSPAIMSACSCGNKLGSIRLPPVDVLAVRTIVSFALPGYTVSF